jgi:hypothetical protein
VRRYFTFEDDVVIEYGFRIRRDLALVEVDLGERDLISPDVTGPLTCGCEACFLSRVCGAI